MKVRKIKQRHNHSSTCGVCGLKTLSLNRGIRDEAQIHLVPSGNQWLWNFTATQSSQDGCSVRVPVEGLQVVVGTLLMLLHLKLSERLDQKRQRKRRMS